jgi:hypothetical protein
MTKNYGPKSTRYSSPSDQEARERLRELYLSAGFVLAPRVGVDEHVGMAYQPSKEAQEDGVVAIVDDAHTVLVLMRDVYARAKTGINRREEDVDAARSAVYEVRNALFGPPANLVQVIQVDQKLVAMGERLFGRHFLAEVRAWRAENNQADPDWFRLAMVYFLNAMASVRQNETVADLVTA